jgi:hypothetical protein
MPFESTLPDRTVASTAAQHVDDHNTMHGILQGKPWHNVRDYGAAGDGVADDTAEIQAAIDACATAGGGIVYMPPGTYKTSAVLSLDEADGAGYQAVSLLGAGSPSTVISYSSNIGLFFGTSRGVVDSLSAPKSMATLQGFELNGPGRATAGSIGLHCKEASYYRLYDIFSQETQTAFYFDTGNSFATGGYHESLRTLQCKYGYVLNDKGEGGSALGECTDEVFIRCYANCSGAVTDSVGWWLARTTTSAFFGCSAESFDYCWVLGSTNTDVQSPTALWAGNSGSVGRNSLFHPRSETGRVQEGIILDGFDNWVFGGNVDWDDTTNTQRNVIIGSKFSVAGDAEALNGQIRLIRPITAADLPTANSDNRGQIYYRPGNAGSKDQIVMSLKAADNSYSWVDLST